MTIGTTPVITTQPSDQTVNAGGTATFTAAADGNPTPTVQWQLSTNGGTTFSPISAATSTTYSFTATTAENGDEYEAVFTNTAGIRQQPRHADRSYGSQGDHEPSPHTAVPGGMASFTAAATATPTDRPVAGQHRVTAALPTSTDGGVYSGSSSDTLRITGATTAMSRYQYEAVFSNAVGAVATTTAATLAVQNSPERDYEPDRPNGQTPEAQRSLRRRPVAIPLPPCSGK